MMITVSLQTKKPSAYPKGFCFVGMTGFEPNPICAFISMIYFILIFAGHRIGYF